MAADTLAAGRLLPAGGPPRLSANATPLAAGVRRITLDGGGPLSALLAEPAGEPPRATILALHGAGMSAGYFDGQAAPDLSLCTLAAANGYRVVAVDRPGFGGSAAGFPDGQSLADQVQTIRRVLRDLAERFGAGAEILLLGHSFGGKVSLCVAAEEPGLLGVDVSGCGHRYASAGVSLDGSTRMMSRSWGPLRLYPPGTFSASRSVIGPVPALELREAHRWPGVFDELAARIRVPVQFTFAEHETWWHHDPAALTELRSRLVRSPLVLVGCQPDAGHNISLGRTARDYHLRVLGFLQSCLDRRAEGAE